jgi:stringent starvation protein B
VLPPKKDVANALLERSSVFIHMDPRPEHVNVPPQFKKAPQLVLQIGLDMPIPIPDLEVDDEGIRCTLSFSRTPFYCMVPWAAVYALVGDDGRGMVWPDDVPPEVAKQAQARTPAPKAGRTSPKRDAADKEPPRSKRPRKTTDTPERDVRTKLVAMPDGSPAATPALTPVADLPGAPTAEPAAATAPPRKPKRELPPYLRVVK